MTASPRHDNSIRHALRAATAYDHARLDALSSHWNLARREDYGVFLRAQAGPLFALEDALEAFGVTALLEDWPDRRRSDALRHDLNVMNLEADAALAAPPRSTAEGFGWLYVLEGSRLGARLLSEQVLQSDDATVHAASHFITHGVGTPLWPRFLQALENAVTPDTFADCSAGACAAFALFETSFSRAAEKASARPQEFAHAG